jgi:SAM-dependent methyltransferase
MTPKQLELVRDVLGARTIEETSEGVRVDGRTYPVLDGVVILVEPAHWTPYVRARLGAAGAGAGAGEPFAESIQYSFGEEWKTYGGILPEHAKEFAQYFDVVDVPALAGRRVLDLGCGSGRWSHFLAGIAAELVLVDFSDAIFVARRNLAAADHAVCFMADILDLPFRDDCADLAFSLGVLHHLPMPCLEAARRLRRLAPRLLLYLYYAFDNRPLHYRVLLVPMTFARAFLSRIRSEPLRRAISRFGTWGVYEPLIALGRLLGSRVPLYDFYKDKSPQRIEQDVYDRFFTGIEQRVTRAQIATLADAFADITVSDGLPYWHFLCVRDAAGVRNSRAASA